MNVLVVEDDVSSRTGLVTLLQGVGHTVCSAWTCSGAIKMLISEKPDIVLLDIFLGAMEMSGLDIARLMREDPEWQKIPIIVTSAMPAEEIRVRASTYAFEGLRCFMMEKPLDADKLLEAIEKMMISTLLRPPV